MTQRSAVRRRPARDMAPRVAVVQADKEARTGDKFTTLLEKATREILAVTYWFDPDSHPGPSSLTVRFSGRRAGVRGRLLPGDRFIQDETIEEVIPGSGPISLTARIHNINPGEWVVTARPLPPVHPPSGSQEQGHSPVVAGPGGPAARFWRKWAPPAETIEPVRTYPPPFARVPGIFPGIWGAMAALGIVVALTIQFLVIAADHLAVGPWWAVSTFAIAVGIVGAKGWYLIVYRREHLVNGWCIQGFITGATGASAILLVALRMPSGVFLDATAPGLLVAMAIGRVGCFFAGCCGGPPTASRFGVWSSDQRVGARRIPTQLMESALALSLGLGTLVTIQNHGPAGGAFFAAAVTAYTLARQGILRLRAESRKTKLGVPVTATLAALVLIAAVTMLVR